jgi:DNA-binding GntR family transcriptional regulator
MHAFSRESRGENIAAIIKDGIVKGFWKPGDPISDLELSKQLGVSRTSVREALSRLVENRIVERIHWKGYYVKELSWPEVESLVEIRKALENIAFSRVMANMPPTLLDQLESCIEAQQECINTDDRDGFMIVDPQFHELVYEASGNHWIPYILDNSLTLLNILRSLDKRNDFTDAAQWSVDQHWGILATMRSGDAKETLRLLNEHIELHKERLRNVISS